MLNSPSNSADNHTNPSNNRSLHTLIPSQVHINHQRNNQPPQSHPHHSHEHHNTHIGNPITNKHNHNIRIVLQNPNGISPDNDFFDYHLYLENMKSISSDIILFTETNLKWNDYNVFKHTTEIRCNVFRFSKQITSSSSIAYDSLYQPGGTCSIITNDMVGRHHSSSSDDPLGRWTITNITISNGQLLSIICCYQVCNHTIQTAGPKTAYAQQWSILRNQGVIAPRPRNQFLHDLDHLIHQLTQNGNQIILAGDFNDDFSDPNGIQRLAIKYSLIDSVEYLHGPYSCTSYARGTKCLDYILLSQSLAPSLRQAGLPAFNTIINSDHRPVYIDIDPSIAFGNQPSSLITPPSRALYSTSPTRCDKYIKCLHQYLTDHNVFERARELNSIMSTDPDQALLLAESIDRDMTRLMLASENKLKRPSPTPFSSPLAQACIGVSLLKTHLIAIKYQTDKSKTINDLQTKLKTPMNLPSNVLELKQQLTELRKKVRLIRKQVLLHRDEHLLALSVDVDISKILKRIRRAEVIRRSYAKIQRSTANKPHHLSRGSIG